MFAVISFGIYGGFVADVTGCPKRAAWEPSAGYEAFPSTGFPLLRAWRQALNHIPPVVPVFAFLSTFLHPLAG